MNLSVIIAILALTSSPCSAFTAPRAFTINPRSVSELSMAELVSEPEGGDEMAQIDPMEDSRMKNMGNADEKGDDVYSFWMTAKAEGSIVKKIRTDLLKQAGKNADFPGFRKGQVPPYAQPQITMFALQEGIIQTCKTAIIAYGLESLGDDDGGSVEVLEDIKELGKGYKPGDDVTFTAKFIAKFDEEKQAKLKEATTSEQAQLEEATTSADSVTE